MSFIRKFTAVSTPGLCRSFSVSTPNNATYSCKILVIGGGTAGCAMAAKFTRRLPKDSVIVLEPMKDHYYQPLFTLAGAGIVTLNQTRRLEENVLPKKAKWIQDFAQCIMPDRNKVMTANGHCIDYEYLIVAAGMNNDYDKVPGLYQALEDKTSGVSSIFAAEYCEKTFSDMQKHKEGNAIFTYPDSLIKCPGAPQKIAYLADSYFNKMYKSKNGRVRGRTHVSMAVSAPARHLSETVNNTCTDHATERVIRCPHSPHY